MLRFSRSGELQTDRKLRIVDGAGAKAWLAGMSQPVDIQNLAEIAQVLRALGALGVQDGSASLDPQRKFAIAERIRGALLDVLGDRIGESQFAVLPLEDDFALHFWAAIDAAIALRDVYAWLVSQLADAPVLAEATLSGAPAPQAESRSSFVSGVGALHRALDVNAQMLLWIQRARWPVPAALWERHCVLGQLVRDLDCQDVEVADALHVSITRTCRAAFVMPVLIALADPAARAAAEFEVVRMAAQRWSAKVGFRLERRVEAPAAGSDPSTAPARPVANPGPSATLGNFIARFDTQSALQSIDRRLDALADGKSPREVGIGDSLRPQVARALLMTLRQRWGAVSPADIDSPERAWRAASSSLQVSVMLGMPSHEARRDGDARSPATTRAAQTYAYHRKAVDAITKPREVVASEKIDQLLADRESWTLVAESPDAVRCIRKHVRPRIGLQRLVGLKLGSTDRDTPFLVGWVEALQGMTVARDDGQYRQIGAHAVRVRLAPGVPQLLNASIDDVELDCAFLLVPSAGTSAAGRAGRTPAFIPMLSDPGLDAERLAAIGSDDWEVVRASPRDYGLILPLASFRPQRLVKASRAGTLAVLRLEELMMRGSDFDLVRFTLL